MNKDSLKVLELNTQVIFGEEKQFKGVITGIIIREDLILYEIGYWKGSCYKPKEVQLST